MVSYLTNSIPLIQLLLATIMVYSRNLLFGKVYLVLSVVLIISMYLLVFVEEDDLSLSHESFAFLTFMSYCFFYDMRDFGVQGELMFCLFCFLSLLLLVECGYDYLYPWLKACNDE